MYIYECIMINNALKIKVLLWKMVVLNHTRAMKYGPHIYNLHPWVGDPLHFLCDTQLFRRAVHFLSQIGPCQKSAHIIITKLLLLFCSIFPVHWAADPISVERNAILQSVLL